MSSSAPVIYTWGAPIWPPIPPRRSSRPGGAVALLDLAPCLRDPHCFDVDELADAVLGELAPVARALDPAEGQARIGLHDAIDEHRTGLDLCRQTLTALAVLGPDRGAETEGRGVGEPDGVRLVLGADHR